MITTDNNFRDIHLKALACWEKYASNQLFEISKDEAKAASRYAKYQKNAIYYDEQSLHTYDYKNIDNIDFKYLDQSRLIDLIKYIKSQKFNVDMIEESTKQNKITLPSPFSSADGVAVCNFSIFLNIQHGRLFLRFVQDDISFYLILHRLPIGIYFPLEKTCISLPGEHHCSLTDHVNALIRETISLMPHLLSAKKDFTFYGLLASYKRPYHYFYDLLPALYDNFKTTNNRAENHVKNIISFDDGAFFSVKELFDLKETKEEIWNIKSNLNKFLIKKSAYVVTPLNYDRRKRIENDKHLNSLDGLIIRKSILNTQDASTYKKACECYPLVWFGICVEKRQWIEQIPGITDIVDRLYSKFDGLGVVFDGITSTIAHQQPRRIIRRIDMENSIVSKISSNINNKIKVFNLVGATASTKIAFACKINFFLTGCGSDSLYVARIAKKPGVCHHTRNWLRSKSPQKHIHPCTSFVPERFVRDIARDDTNISSFNLSYSIDPDCIKKCLTELLLESPIGDP